MFIRTMMKVTSRRSNICRRDYWAHIFMPLHRKAMKHKSLHGWKCGAKHNGKHWVLRRGKCPCHERRTNQRDEAEDQVGSSNLLPPSVISFRKARIYHFKGIDTHSMTSQPLDGNRPLYWKADKTVFTFKEPFLCFGWAIIHCNPRKAFPVCLRRCLYPFQGGTQSP